MSGNSGTKFADHGVAAVVAVGSEVSVANGVAIPAGVFSMKGVSVGNGAAPDGVFVAAGEEPEDVLVAEVPGAAAGVVPPPDVGVMQLGVRVGVLVPVEGVAGLGVPIA
jgi:hypothetical protein